MPLQKACFKILEGEYQGEEFKVQFNPTELSFSKNAQLAEIAIPGLDSPVLQFIRGSNETLSAELFFDTTELGMGDEAVSVTEDFTIGTDNFAGTDKFYGLVKQDKSTHAPPRCRFSWGEAAAGGDEVSKAPAWFTGVIESVERKFLLFSPQGKPLRARLTVRMREYKTVEGMVAELQSADHTKARVLKRRQRLDQIAANEYDTPTEWRRIAEANGIDDPRRVPPGTTLVIPPMRVESLTREPE